MSSDILILCCIGVLAAAIIGRIVFKAHTETVKRNRLMEAQVQLLLLLTQKNRNPEAIKRIIKDSKIELSDELLNALNEEEKESII